MHFVTHFQLVSPTMHPEILISRFTWKESGQEDDDVLTHQHRFLQHLHFLLRSHLRLDPA